MARRASLQLGAFEVPERWKGKVPAVGLASVGAAEVDDAERDRIGAEVSKGNQLIAKAKRSQQQLLERLARAAGPRGARFLLLSTLERFLATTKSLDAKKAAALSDAELGELWHKAEAVEATLRSAPPEPEVRMSLTGAARGTAPSLTFEVVGRVGPEPTIPDRIAQEAHIAAVLISKASPAQVALVERVARAAGDAGVQFPFVTMLAKFLAATRTLDEKAAAKLSDDEVARLWRDATEPE